MKENTWVQHHISDMASSSIARGISAVVVKTQSSRVSRLEKRFNTLEQKMFQDTTAFREDIEMILETLRHSINSSSEDSLEKETDNEYTTENKEMSTKVDITVEMVKKAMTEEKGYIRTTLGEMWKQIEGIRNECVGNEKELLEKLEVTTVNYEELRRDLVFQGSELQKTKEQLEKKEEEAAFNTNSSKQLNDETEKEISTLRQELHIEKESFDLKVQKLEQKLNSLSARQCSDPSWTSFGTSCYHVGEDSLTWWEAKRKCESYAGKLVEVDDYSTNSFLIRLVKRKGVGGDGVWLGATDYKREGNWIWSSDDRQLAFSNFKGSEPNGKSGENCLHLNRHSDWAWNDTTCYANMRYICERERL